MQFKFKELVHMQTDKGDEHGIPDNLRASEKRSVGRPLGSTSSKPMTSRPYKVSRSKIIGFMSAHPNGETFKMTDFAEHLGITTQAVGQIIRRMVEEGYVKRLDHRTYIQVKKQTNLPKGDPKNGPVFVTPGTSETPMQSQAVEAGFGTVQVDKSSIEPAVTMPEWQDIVRETTKEELNFSDYDMLIWRYVKFEKPTQALAFIDFSKWLEEYLKNGK
jgi:hypothetical protein